MTDETLARALVDEGVVAPAAIARALADSGREGTTLVRTLLEKRYLADEQLAHAVSRLTGTPLIEPLPLDVAPWIRRRLPVSIAREYLVYPVELESGELTVAMVDPTDRNVIEILEIATRARIRPLVAIRSSLEQVIELFYSIDFDADATVMSVPSMRFDDEAPPHGSDDAVPARPAQTEAMADGSPDRTSAPSGQDETEATAVDPGDATIAAPAGAIAGQPASLEERVRRLETVVHWLVDRIREIDRGRG